MEAVTAKMLKEHIMSKILALVFKILCIQFEKAVGVPVGQRSACHGSISIQLCKYAIIQVW